MNGLSTATSTGLSGWQYMAAAQSGVIAGSSPGLSDMPAGAQLAMPASVSLPVPPQLAAQPLRAPYPWRLDSGAPPPPPPPCNPPGQPFPSSSTAPGLMLGQVGATSMPTNWPAAGPAGTPFGVLASVSVPAAVPPNQLLSGVSQASNSSPIIDVQLMPAAGSWQPNSVNQAGSASQTVATAPVDPWADSVAHGLDKWQSFDAWAAPAPPQDAGGVSTTHADAPVANSSTAVGSSASAASSSSGAGHSTEGNRPDAALRSAPAATNISADQIPKWMKQLAAPTLKMELEIRGLSTEGKRFSLLQRLAASLEKSEQLSHQEGAALPKEAAGEPIAGVASATDSEDRRRRDRSRSREKPVLDVEEKVGNLQPAPSSKHEDCATSDPYFTGDDSMEILVDGTEKAHEQRLASNAEPVPPERLSLTEAVCPPEVRKSILRWWRQLRSGQSRVEELRQLRERRDREYEEKVAGLELQAREKCQKVEDWANSRLEALLQQRREEAENARCRVHDLNRAFEARQAEILLEAGLHASQVDDPLPEHITANFAKVKESLMAKVPEIIAERDRTFAAIKAKASRIRNRQQAEREKLKQRLAALNESFEAAFQKRVAEIEAKYDEGSMSGVPPEVLHKISREVFAARVDLKAVVEGLQKLADPPAELVRAARGVARAVHGISASRSPHATPQGNAAAAPLAPASHAQEPRKPRRVFRG